MARTLLTDDTFPVRETELALEMPLDPDAVYYLRALTTDLTRQIAKAHTKRIPNPRTHQMEDVRDDHALNDALFDYCLVRWEGMAGSPDCVLENKKKLPMEIQAALLRRAQIGQVTPQAKAASFREPQNVVPVLER